MLQISCVCWEDEKCIGRVSDTCNVACVNFFSDNNVSLCMQGM